MIESAGTLDRLSASVTQNSLPLVFDAESTS